MPAGQKHSELSLALQKEKLEEFEEKYFTANNAMMMNRNTLALTNTRVLCTIFIGIAAGILGFDGPIGILFYFAADVIVSLIMVARFGFQPKPYFTSLAKIFNTGLISGVMTFMVTWVLFHNLVYIL